MAANIPFWLLLVINFFLLPMGGNSLRANPQSSADYTWWLATWADGQMVCELKINHEGTPSGVEVYTQCGEGYYTTWLQTPPCLAAAAGQDTAACTGVYLRFISVEYIEGEGDLVADYSDMPLYDLPAPQAWLDIQGCEFGTKSYTCLTPPTLIIRAEEFLPTEQIVAIEGKVDATPFQCDGANTCEVELPATVPEGVPMSFYAISSSGRSSQLYLARLRVLEHQQSWQVNVLSDRWQGNSLSSCEQVWGAFPPIDDLPTWLASPQDPSQLASDQPYNYLAGRLITKGVVDGTACARYGLESNGYANTCGLELARSEVNTWQDRFDTQIIAAATKAGIPSQVIKNLIAQESQFWPGSWVYSPEERGLGQLTPEGADTVLLWNPDIFQQVCKRILHPDTCQQGYASISALERNLVRGGLMQRVNADCPHCFMGIDMIIADQSVEIFAWALKANCQQTGQLISNLRGKSPGAVSSFEDLWRFTLVNYHAGAGCLNNAIALVPQDQPLSWDNLQPMLDAECPGASDYIKAITR